MLTIEDLKVLDDIKEAPMSLNLSRLTINLKNN